MGVIVRVIMVMIVIVVVGVVMRGWGGTVLGQRRPGQGKRRGDQQTGGRASEWHGRSFYRSDEIMDMIYHHITGPQ